MFFTKLFLVLALVMLAGQQLSANSANDFSRPDDSNYVPPASSSNTQPPASSSASPPVAPSSTSNDAQSNRIPAADQPIHANESSTNDTLDAEDDEADHMNYILTNGRDYYVGAGPLGIDLQHLKIIAIIAHLKVENEKPIHYTPGTAKYTKLADSLIAGKSIGLIKLEPLATPDRAKFNKGTLFRLLIDLKQIPNLNSEVPLPDLETRLTPENLKISKCYAAKLIRDALPQWQQFDWKTLEADMSSSILKFKQSPLYTFKTIDAKCIEIWVLSGMETVTE